jgi:hypothetical protein
MNRFLLISTKKWDDSRAFFILTIGVMLFSSNVFMNEANGEEQWIRSEIPCSLAPTATINGGSDSQVQVKETENEFVVLTPEITGNLKSIYQKLKSLRDYIPAGDEGGYYVDVRSRTLRAREALLSLIGREPSSKTILFLIEEAVRLESEIPEYILDDRAIIKIAKEALTHINQNNEELIPTLIMIGIEGVKKEEAEVARKLLGQIGIPAILPLLKILEDQHTSWAIRYQVINDILANMQASDLTSEPKVVQVLSQLLNGPFKKQISYDEYIDKNRSRQSAVIVLEKIGAVNVNTEIITLLAKISVDKNETHGIRTSANNVLNRILKERTEITAGKNAIPTPPERITKQELLEALTMSDGLLLKYRFSFGDYGGNDLTGDTLNIVQETLVFFELTPGQQFRRKVDGGELSVESLIQEFPGFRSNAGMSDIVVNALARIGDSAVPALLVSLADEDWAIVIGSLMALEKMKIQKESPDMITAILNLLRKPLGKRDGVSASEARKIALRILNRVNNIGGITMDKMEMIRILSAVAGNPGEMKETIEMAAQLRYALILQNETYLLLSL